VVRFGLVGTAAQHRLHTQSLREGTACRDGVRAQLQTDQAVGFVAEHGQHDHRHRRVLTQAPEHLRTVEPRQHQVEHNEVRRVDNLGIQRLLPIGDDADSEAGRATGTGRRRRSPWCRHRPPVPAGRSPLAPQNPPYSRR